MTLLEGNRIRALEGRWKGAGRAFRVLREHLSLRWRMLEGNG